MSKYICVSQQCFKLNCDGDAIARLDAVREVAATAADEQTGCWHTAESRFLQS